MKEGRRTENEGWRMKENEGWRGWRWVPDSPCSLIIGTIPSHVIFCLTMRYTILRANISVNPSSIFGRGSRVVIYKKMRCEKQVAYLNDLHSLHSSPHTPFTLRPLSFTSDSFFTFLILRPPFSIPRCKKSKWRHHVLRVTEDASTRVSPRARAYFAPFAKKK